MSIGAAQMQSMGHALEHSKELTAAQLGGDKIQTTVQKSHTLGQAFGAAGHALKAESLLPVQFGAMDCKKQFQPKC
jgi:hypothetical protein